MRRRRLLDAAAKVFLAQGYPAATMDAVAVAAGMSKKTLYQLYGSKLALFEAVLGDRLFEIEVPEPDPALPQEERLTQLLLTVGRSLANPERIALLRLVIRDSHGSGALARCFERVRMDHDMTVIERWFDDERAAGRLSPGPLNDAVRHVFGLTIGQQLLETLLGIGKTENLEAHVRRGVALYLGGLKAIGPTLG